MGMTYLCNLFLMPVAERNMKDLVFNIRADIGAAILREGAFTTTADGKWTVFIREMRPDGQIRGILVHDNRDKERPVSYLAQSGMLVDQVGDLTSHHAELESYRAGAEGRRGSFDTEIRPLCFSISTAMPAPSA